MLKRFGTHLRGNVVGYVALFVVLGGSAVALPGKGVIDKNDLQKNVVKTKNVKNGAIKTNKLAANAATGAKVNEGSLDFTCGSGRKEAEGYCWDTTFVTSDSWESTFTDCANRGGQLPSLALLVAALDELAYPASTDDLWAGQVYEDGADRAVAIDVSSALPVQQNASNSHPAVCAYPLVD